MLPPMPSIAGIWSSIGPTGRLDRLRAELDRASEGAQAASLTRNAIAQAEGPCGARELLAEALRFRIDDEIDVALPVQRHVLAAVARDDRKPHARKQRPQLLRVRRRVLDEFEAVGAHRVVEQVAHDPLPH